MNRKLNFLIAPAIMLLCFAGIMRDDVSETAYLNLGKEKQFNCVGKVFIGNKFSGSCVLIGKRYILSAAHVFKRYTFRSDTMMIGGNKVVANVPIGSSNVTAAECLFNFNGVSYKGRTINFYKDTLTGKEAYDLVLIELESEVINIKPADINDKLNELHTDVVGVGYGASGFATKIAETKSAQLKVAGENVVDSIGGKMRNGKPTLLICDFDSPTKPALNRIGSATPKKLEYLCNGGDSGGGLFRMIDGKWELIGICASAEAGMDTFVKNGYYGLLMQWTRTAVFADWISRLIKR
jgi:hypothetical protein